MTEWIQDIWSDSSVERIEVRPGVVLIEVRLYTENRIALEFSDFIGMQIHTRWSRSELVAGVLISDRSDFLAKMVIELREDEENVEGLRSYQFTSIDGILLEVIARSWRCTPA